VLRAFRFDNHLTQVRNTLSKEPDMQRRNFIQLAGGGTLAAAAGTTAIASGCASTGGSPYPAQAVEAWNGPGADPQAAADPRRWAVAHAITAPNPHNLQPWLVDLREANAITLYTDPQRVLPETDPMGRQILIGHGAFLELLVIALAERGMNADVKLWPNGELNEKLADWRGQAASRPIARLTLSPGASKDPLFAQILQRHTPKSDFDTTRPVAPSALAALVAATPGTLIKTAGTVDPERLPALRALCIESAKVEVGTPHTMMESVHLLRVGPGEILQHRDGISMMSPFVRALNALGLFDRTTAPPVGSTAYKTALQRFEGHSNTAMGFVWLSTPGNTRVQQLQAGRAYVRLQLKATETGLGVHPMSQALQEFKEMQPLYAQAHQLLVGKAAPSTTADETVQMFCRLGHLPGTQVAPATPRRPINAFYTT
jgi:hypothetical protein